MQSALDAADAALEAKETALKSLFHTSEVEKLGKLLDMSTLEPHEVKNATYVATLTSSKGVST